jgi:hypothetical protein
VVGGGGVGVGDEEMEGVDIGWFVSRLQEERRGMRGVLSVSFGRVLGAFCMAIFVVFGVVRVVCWCMLDVQ